MAGLSKDAIIDVLEDIATLLELKGENPFKIRAYENGARALETLDDPLEDVIAEERLGAIKGIGSALVDKIETLYRDGALPYYEDLKASVPQGLVAMSEIPGLGGKKIKKIHDALGIEDIGSLEAACRDGRIAGLKGFGQKTADNILNGIENRKAYGARHLWWDVRGVVEPILEGLRALEAVAEAEVAGSYRRRRETVGDLDFVVASDDPDPVMDWFTGLSNIEAVSAKGETKSSVRFEGGLQADLRVVPPKQFPFALHHFTGSKDHNVRMRQRALERGLSLSEWGLEPKETGKTVKETARQEASVQSEADLFALLDMQYVPPELREDMGEVEHAADRRKTFPDLVAVSDIRGAFHNHTKDSDGRDSLEDMVAAAEAQGWEYYGTGDHSKASFQANGLDEARVREQLERVRRLDQEKGDAIRLFAGIECDILQDGRLDLDDDLLADLDFVVVSVHGSMSQDSDTMTQRIIRALEHPYSTMLGHLTGRILLRREPYAVAISKVIDAAIANGKIIELNANPHRLDMDWRHWKRAADKGLICAINPDAHRKDGLDHVTAGVMAARKGWLAADHILNCWPLKKVEEHLGKIRAGKAGR